MAGRRRLDALLLREPGEVGFFEAVKLVQERIQCATEADEAGRELLERGEAAEARQRFEEGVELTEFSQGREACMWRVVLRDKQKTALIYSEPSVTSRTLGSRSPDDRVYVDVSKGDWVRLHADEGFGEEPAWMIINRSGAAKGMGVMLEPEVSAQSRTRARELYLSLRLSAARACLALGDGTHAALHATAALLFDEDNQEAVFLRAVANISLDSETRIEEARDDLERLLELQPDSQELKEHLARAKERLGEHQEELDLRKAEEEKQRQEEEARQRDLQEVQELRAQFRKKAEERRKVQEEEGALARARREEEEALAQAAAPETAGASSSSTSAPAAEGPGRPALSLLAQVSRLASSVPRPAPLPLPDKPVDQPAVEAGEPDEGEVGGKEASTGPPVSFAPLGAPLGAGRGLGLRSRGLGLRGRGLPGRGRGAPAPERSGEAPAAAPEEEAGAQPQPAASSGSAYPSPSQPAAARGPPARVTEDEAAANVDRGVWRRVLARPKKDSASGLTQRQMKAEDGSEIKTLRKELRQLNRQKAHAIEQEDFQRAKELKQQQDKVAAQLKTAELKARDQAASRLANVRDEVRHLEAQIREVSEAGELDRAVEIRQRRDKLKAEMRRMEWMQQG